MLKIPKQKIEYDDLGVKKSQTYTKSKQIKLHKKSHDLSDKKNNTDVKPFTIRKPRQLNTTQFDIKSLKFSHVINENSPTNSSEIETKEKKHKGSEYSIKDLNNFNVEFSYKEDRNRIFKEKMEDMGKSVVNFNDKTNTILLTLFDGHGGDLVSSFLAHNFDKFLKKNLLDDKNEIKESILKTFTDLDDKIKENSLNGGSTGTILYITEEDNKKILYCANVGDTRCTLYTDKKYEKLSYDHRANDPSEKNRIINSGGNLRNGRVNGKLMLSRVFGDFELRDFGVNCEPYIIRKEIDINIKNQFIILASDGIWDHIEDNDIQNFIYETFNKCNKEDIVTKKICERLVQECFNFGSSDNISVFVIKIT